MKCQENFPQTFVTSLWNWKQNEFKMLVCIQWPDGLTCKVWFSRLMVKCKTRSGLCRRFSRFTVKLESWLIKPTKLKQTRTFWKEPLCNFVTFTCALKWSFRNSDGDTGESDSLYSISARCGFLNRAWWSRYWCILSGRGGGDEKQPLAGHNHKC